MKTVAVVTVEAQVKAPLATAHLPLLELKVNPLPRKKRSTPSSAQRHHLNSPLAVAVKEAQVPVVYQAPELIKHPF